MSTLKGVKFELFFVSSFKKASSQLHTMMKKKKIFQDGIMQLGKNLGALGTAFTYIHIPTHIHTYTYIHITIYIHTYPYLHAYRCLPTCIQIPTYTYISLPTY